MTSCVSWLAMPPAAAYSGFTVLQQHLWHLLPQRHAHPLPSWPFTWRTWRFSNVGAQRPRMPCLSCLALRTVHAWHCCGPLEDTHCSSSHQLYQHVSNIMYRCLCTAGPDGDTAIHLACLYGQKGCVEALIAAGCKLDPINSEDGTTPLHDAAAGGYAGIAQLLFDKAGLGMVPLLVSKCSVVSGFR